MSAPQSAIDAFLDSVRSGEWQNMGRHYHPDITFRGTVPRWYFTVNGRDGVVRQMEEWFPHEADVSDTHVMVTPDGAVVEFERHWLRPVDTEGGADEEVGVRQAHIFRLNAEGQIYEQHGHCAGIWDAATFAEAERALAVT